jgi:hypothetical protein
LIAAAMRRSVLGWAVAVALMPSMGSGETLGLAGVPIDLAQGAGYERMFAELDASGLKVFLPTFQYQEVPEARTLGREVDFLPPCDPQSAAFRALRESGVQLIVPGALLYAPGLAGQVSGDPLAALLACAGRDSVYGVLSFDEPVLNGVAENEVAALYRAVKAVDPSLPVLMVHAPLVADRPEHATATGRDQYLAAVARYSQWSDIAGFDLYPVPQALAQILGPEGQVAEGPGDLIRAYADWLAATVPDRAHFTVLQGFAIRDLYDPDWALEAVGADLLALARPPTPDEMDAMFAAARAAGHDPILWWGAAALADVSQAPWPDIVRIGREAAR